MDMTALVLSRLQFAFTITFHIIFPSFTIGLAAWLIVLEALRLATETTRNRLPKCIIPFVITVDEAAAPASSLAFMFWGGVVVFPLMLHAHQLQRLQRQDQNNSRTLLVAT